MKIASLSNFRSRWAVTFFFLLVLEGAPRFKMEDRRTASFLPSSTQVSRVPSSAPGKGSVLTVEPTDQQKLWRDFQDRFGRNLRPEFSRVGNLVSVLGKAGEGEFAPGDFQPDHPQEAIARAREILLGAQGLMGVRASWPLENALARGSPLSAQVFLNQTYEGLMVVPVGIVKVDLGPKGELLGLFSDYVRDVKIENHIQMDSDEAQSRVYPAFQSPNQTSLHVDGGGKVIWVEGGSGRYAYQFLVRGRRVVVDAQTGKILDTKDIRQY